MSIMNTHLALRKDVPEFVGGLLGGEESPEGAVHRRVQAEVQGRPRQVLVQAAHNSSTH